MSEELVEKVIFSVTPETIEPERSVVKKSIKKEKKKSLQHSTIHGEKPIQARYLRGSVGSCHDICKYGFRHVNEAKQSHQVLQRSLGSTRKLEQERVLNKQKSSRRSKYKPLSSQNDLPAERERHFPCSRKSGHINDKDSNLSKFETNESSKEFSTINSIASLAAEDINASDKHVSSDFSDGLMNESASMESDRTTTLIIMGIENDKYFTQKEGSSFEPISIKYMIPTNLSQTSATSENISNNNSEESTEDKIGSGITTTSSIAKRIINDDNATCGAQKSSSKNVKTIKNQIGSSSGRMQMKNHNKLESDKHRSVEKAKGALGGKLKSSSSTRSRTPSSQLKTSSSTRSSIPSSLQKTPPSTGGSTLSSQLKNSPAIRRSTPSIVCAPKNQAVALSEKKRQTKNSSKDDLKEKEEKEKLISGNVKVNKQEKDATELSPIEENTSLKKVVKSVKKDASLTSHSKKLPHLNNASSLKLSKERNTTPLSTVKSQIRVGKLSSKGKTIPAITTKVEKIDLKNIKDKLRRRNASPTDKKEVFEESDVKKDLMERNSDQATKNENNTRHKRTAGSLSDDSASLHKKFSSIKSKVVNLQVDSNTPIKLKFAQGRTVTGNDNSKGEIRMKSFRKRIESVGNSRKPVIPTVALRHQEVQDKKEVQGLFNNVIEKTANKLVETRKSKVKALVGAFETVISLQESKAAPVVAVP